MLGKDYAAQDCSIARALEVVGERWTLLVLRDLATGVTRFDDLVDSVGVTRSVLTSRLRSLEEEGVVERRPYGTHPGRYAYVLTAKGQALVPVLAHLLWWGDTYYPSAAGPPRRLVHHDCGGSVHNGFTCMRCGSDLVAADVTSVPRAG